MNRLENLLCKSFPPQRTYVLIIAWIIYYLFCLGVGKAELLGGEEGSVGTAKALLLCPESTARSPAAEHWCDSIDWPWQCPGVRRCMKGRGTAGYFALCSGGSVLGCPKAIHIIPSTSAQLLCPNSAPEVHKTSFALQPQPHVWFRLCSTTTSGGTANGSPTTHHPLHYGAHGAIGVSLCPQVTSASQRVCMCLSQGHQVAFGLSPELLHQAKGKVDNLGVVRSLRIQQHSCIQTRWGSNKGILALPSRRCLKLPCIVCPMLRVSPQH